MIDDDFAGNVRLSTGQADSNVEPPAGEWAAIRAILWLPDPEARRGWREFYVREPQKEKPGRRAGF